MNVIARLEFELACFEDAVQYFSYYSTGTLFVKVWISKRKRISYVKSADLLLVKVLDLRSLVGLFDIGIPQNLRYPHDLAIVVNTSSSGRGDKQQRLVRITNTSWIRKKKIMDQWHQSKRIIQAADTRNGHLSVWHSSLRSTQCGQNSFRRWKIWKVGSAGWRPKYRNISMATFAYTTNRNSTNHLIFWYLHSHAYCKWKLSCRVEKRFLYV